MKRIMPSLVLAGLCSLLATTFASVDNGGFAGLYERKTTLAETLMATRANYAVWVAEQTPARATVKWGTWRATELSRADAAMPADDAKTSDGKPLWTPRPEWRDSTRLRLAPADGHASSVAVWLSREVTAEKPVDITVGLGGGSRLELWLNGRRVVSENTALRHERYGTAMRAEGNEFDQLLVELKLPAGRSRLTLKIEQAVVDRSSPMHGWFSPSPNPVPRFWERLRRDFPPASNPLLEAVNFRWFEPGGWFDCSKDTRFEEELLASLNAAPDVHPTLEQCIVAVDLAVARKGIAKLRLAVAELGGLFPEEYPAADFLRKLTALDRDAGKLVCLTNIDRCRREMLVDANPLLKGRKIVFARRHTYDSQHYYDDYYHGPTQWGGNLTELDLATGRTRDLVPQLSGGIFDRYDLSHDGTRVVFGYRPCKPDGYRIWEQRLDGTGLRQLTFPPADEAERVARHSAYPKTALERDPRLYGHWTDDMHPCYLPDGRIVFASSRNESTAYCGTHIHTMTSLHRIDGDGRNLRQLSQGALTESTPTMLDDGRILYTRWEYVYKGIAAVQSLWAMRPDGTGAEEVYGNNIDNPGVFFAGRQVPSRPDLVVAAGVGHEPLAVGSIRLIDRNKDRRSKDAMTTLTPEVETRGLRGLHQFRNGRWVEDVRGSFHCDPYPLSEKFFLVSHAPDNRYNDPKGYGIWLLDAFGNCVPIHRDETMSCFQPMLLAPRPLEPKLPELSRGPGAEQDEATVLLVDLYRGLEGVEHGTIQYLRVMEQVPRSWVASQNPPADAAPGQSPAISLGTHTWVAVLLGIVPVEADGSALFKVPARRNLFFTVLDKDFMEVQKMRTFVNFQPGEARSCIGCHDPRDGARAPDQPLATLRPPRAIAPQPGDRGARPIHYPSDVQPVFDKHCARCHSGERPEGSLDLTGELTTHFNRSYEDILRKGLVNFIQEWTGPAPDKGGPAYVSNGSMMHAEAVPPYTHGSHKSRLIEVLRNGHRDVKLSREEFIKLVTWVDANAPFYGSYFGRRHIAAKNRPDFRPVATLESARGMPPPPYTAPPLPAEPLGTWTRGDLPERFDGRNFVQGKTSGTLQAVSVALWVRADGLGNTWNPLLFTDGSGLSSFHFSLLKDGTPNVAIHDGGKVWIHSRADVAVTPGSWHHLAVVCDPRVGGVIRFYVDGKPAGSKPLDLGIPLDLAAYRLGAWKPWEKTPANNFHGTLDDVRLYRGTLTDAEVAALAQTARREPNP